MSEPIAHLAGEELRGGRHVSAFFEDRAEADRVLVPFAREGLAQGDRVVAVVAADMRDASLSMLRVAGVDVDEALASGALQVKAWEDTYLRGGRFDQAAMLTLIIGILAQGHEDGYARTRYVADMEWALRGSTPVQEIIDYEDRVDKALRKLPDVVVCSYSSRHFGAPMVVDILAVHPVALVGGALRSTRGEHVRTAPRQRILKATHRLFHAEGIHATSVDAIIAEADVAKATLYRHFPTKDDLVVAWLEDARPRWFDRVRKSAEVQGGTDSGAFIGALFDAIGEWLAGDDFRGCPYLNAAVEIVDPAHPARAVIDAFLDDVVLQLRSIVDVPGTSDPAGLARELQVLIAGAMVLAVARRTTDPVMAARGAALRLLAAHGAVIAPPGRA